MKSNLIPCNINQTIQIGLTSIFLVSFIFMTYTWKIRSKVYAMSIVIPSSNSNSLFSVQKAYSISNFKTFNLYHTVSDNKGILDNARDSLNIYIQSNQYNKGILLQFPNEMDYEVLVYCLNLAIINDWKYYALDIYNNRFYCF